MRLIIIDETVDPPSDHEIGISDENGEGDKLFAFLGEMEQIIEQKKHGGDFGKALKLAYKRYDKVGNIDKEDDEEDTEDVTTTSD